MAASNGCSTSPRFPAKVGSATTWWPRSRQRPARWGRGNGKRQQWACGPSSARPAAGWPDNRPAMRGLADLSVADMRMMLLAMRMPSGDLPVGTARALFGYNTVISDGVRHERARHRHRNRPGARQPYTAGELRWMRHVVRRAMLRSASAARRLMISAAGAMSVIRSIASLAQTEMTSGSLRATASA